MRQDMAKVIVERPRPGSSRHVPRRGRRLDFTRVVVSEDDDDPVPTHIGHRRLARQISDPKCLNENLSPLRRYLEAQVGRPWNDVWAEICGHIRVDNAVQKHVRDHVQDFVAIRTALRDGVVVSAGRWGRPEPIADCRWPKLYVDPASGILRRNEGARRERARRRQAAAAKALELAARMRKPTADRQLHLLDDGNWWEITLAPIPQWAVVENGRRTTRSAVVVDVVERAGLSSLPRVERYDRSGVYAVAKRALSHREIKTMKLRA